MTNFIFNPQEKGFSFQNALALLESSCLAYEDKEKIIGTAKNEWGFDDCVFIEEGETQGFIAKRTDLIVLAFRGTEQKKIVDILTDVFAWRTKIFWGKVHAGFNYALDIAFENIVLTLKRMQDNKQPIWITGHSLGGALATLVAARLIHDAAIETIGGIYTYGQPLVGDGEFKEKMKEAFGGKFYRVTNFLDPVSLVPFKIWKYRHVGEIVLFDKEGHRVQGSNWKIRTLLIFLPLVLVVIAFLNKKKDLLSKQLNNFVLPHGIPLYRENVQRNIPT